MTDSPDTRHSLLVRIRNARDAEAWVQFVDLYAPLVYRFARRRGLQDADAADLTQEVLRAVVRAAQRQYYNPKKGSFRGWLFTIALNKLRNFVINRRRHPPASGDSAEQAQVEEQPDRSSEDATWWELEYEQRLFDWAAERVQGDFEPATWQASGTPPSKVYRPKTWPHRWAFPLVRSTLPRAACSLDSELAFNTTSSREIRADESLTRTGSEQRRRVSIYRYEPVFHWSVVIGP
jgi:RNA polymerase sigma-70 factor (ECF subfamily)